MNRCFAAVLLAAALLAGCGGSGSSKKDFLAKADRACTESNRSRPARPPRNAREAAQQTQQEVAARVKLDRQLRSLSPPSDLKDDVASYNAQTKKVIGLIRLQHAAAVANRESRFGQLGRRLDTLLRQRDGTAARIGFKVCGRATRKKQ